MSDQSFKVRNWRPGTIRFVALKIGPLSDPETKRDSVYTTTPGATPTLYICDRGQGPVVQRYTQERGTLYNVDGDSQHYFALLERLEGSGPGSAFGDSIVDAGMVVTLFDHRYHWQRKHAGSATESANHWIKLSQLFQDYIWEGAPIVATLVTEQNDYNSDPAVGVDGHYHKGQAIFTGVIDDIECDDDRVYLRCAPDKEWDVEVPNSEKPAGGSGPSIITRQAYPNAPDQYVGAAIPMVFSRRGYTGMLNGAKPWAISTSVLDGLTPAVITEHAISSTKLLKIVANKWSAHGAAPSAANSKAFILHGTLLSEFTTAASSSTTESYLEIDHDALNRIYIWGDRVSDFSASEVTNPERAVDGKLDTYATIVHSGTDRYLDLEVPSIASLGKMANLMTYIVIDGSSVGAGANDGIDNVQFGLWNNYNNAWHVPTNNTGGKNPGILEKVHVNAATDRYESGQWANGLNEWDATDQPTSDWRWQGYNRADKAAEALVFRIKVIQNGCTLNVIGGGVLVAFNPATPIDAGDLVTPAVAREIKGGRKAPGGGFRTR